jgi:hypothetical protein
MLESSLCVFPSFLHQTLAATAIFMHIISFL